MWKIKCAHLFITRNPIIYLVKLFYFRIYLHKNSFFPLVVLSMPISVLFCDLFQFIHINLVFLWLCSYLNINNKKGYRTQESHINPLSIKIIDAELKYLNFYSINTWLSTETQYLLKLIYADLYINKNRFFIT